MNVAEHAVRTTTSRKIEKYPALESYDIGGGRELQFFGTGDCRYRWRVIDHTQSDPVNLASSPSWYPSLDECRAKTRWLRPWRWLKRVAVVAKLRLRPHCDTGAARMNTDHTVARIAVFREQLQTLRDFTAGDVTGLLDPAAFADDPIGYFIGADREDRLIIWNTMMGRGKPSVVSMSEFRKKRK